MSFYLFIPAQIQPSAVPSLTICLFLKTKKRRILRQSLSYSNKTLWKFINEVELKGGPHGPSIR